MVIASILRIRGTARHYDWGGFDFIPSLLGLNNGTRKPFAELWIGTHPGGPATVESVAGDEPLTRVIERSPREILGAAAEQFENKLPYLLKVLDARKMLSIQAHPTIPQAVEGYAREDAEGIALDAPTRNYKDRNHKPEVHVALTDFWMLHGFRPVTEIAELLRNTPELAELPWSSSNVPSSTLRRLYERIMTLPQSDVDRILAPLLGRLRAHPPMDKSDPGFWALRAADHFPLPDGHIDRGIFSVFLLNLVHLRPGQATFQPAGTLHAYLEGVNVELMANSDNVLRGGLTPKHVDVPELMRIVDFADGKPAILAGHPQSAAETVYCTPATEFELSRITLSPGVVYRSADRHGPDTLIVIEGKPAMMEGTGERLPDAAVALRIGIGVHELHPLARGQIVMIPANVPYTMESSTGAVVFRATVPQALIANR